MSLHVNNKLITVYKKYFLLPLGAEFDVPVITFQSEYFKDDVFEFLYLVFTLQVRGDDSVSRVKTVKSGYTEQPVSCHF